jgi:hypothetical protein
MCLVLESVVISYRNVLILRNSASMIRKTLSRAAAVPHFGRPTPKTAALLFVSHWIDLNLLYKMGISSVKTF